MLRFLWLAAFLVLAADVLAQPLAPEAPAVPAGPVASGTEIASEAPARLRLAVVVEQQQNDGSGCGSGDSSCDGGGCGGSSGGSCNDSDADGAACALVGGCVVAGAAVGYGIYRLVKKPRSPDSLSVGAADALAQALAAHAEIVSPEDAEVVVSVQQAGARRGVGLVANARPFIVTATDRNGRAVALGDGPLPSAHLVLAAEAPEWAEAARRLVARLAP